MTQCIRCHADKLPGEFYARDRTCRECRSALVRAYRKANLDRYREFERKRALKPNRVEARRQYQKNLSLEQQKKHQTRVLLWQQRNKDKRAAHIVVGNALRDGKLHRQSCEICGARAQAHHEDYSKPLEVKWLCRIHHGLRHREINELARRSQSATI